MPVKFIFLVLFLAVLSASSQAHTDSRVLTIRQLPGNEFEAVVTFDSTLCGSTVNPPSSVQVVGSEVRIESPPLVSQPCIGTPIPPSIFVETTINIGSLAPGNYNVSWIQPASFALFKALFVSATSQEGPLVPCIGCDTLTQAPFPETGSWYNPDQSGSGVSMEIQNGVLVGYYFGYDINGNAMWYLFSGLLVRSTQAGVQWELNTHLQHFQGGNCLGCVYEPPKAPTEGPAIRLEFLQRNNMRLTIDSNPGQFFVPIIYGSVGRSYFSAQTPFIFPEYGGFFMLVFRPNADPPEPWNWGIELLLVRKGRVPQGGADEGRLIYDIWPSDPPPSLDVKVGSIECGLEAGTNQPGCEVSVNGKGTFIMPIGQMSDSRFFGEAADGSTVEAYRLDYD